VLSLPFHTSKSLFVLIWSDDSIRQEERASPNGGYKEGDFD
jgi:hypothetical protein